MRFTKIEAMAEKKKKTVKKRTVGRKPVSKEVQEKMKKLLKAGHTYKVVSEVTGVAIPTIGRYNSKWGF